MPEKITDQVPASFRASLENGPPPGGAEAWHALLLRMAGAVPDDLLSEARSWLAEDQRADIAQAIGFFVLTNRIPVTAADGALLIVELIADGQDIDALADLELAPEGEERSLPWAFSAVPVEEEGIPEQVDRGPLTLDLSADPVGLDPIDAAAVAAVENEPAVLGLWRAWRVPVPAAGGSPGPAPRRVFVVSVPGDAEAAEPARLAALIQEALLTAGEENPQVEVCLDGRPVPTYQSAACARAALLWAAEAALPIQLARVFDTVDPQTGPSFDAGHPVIEDLTEIERLLEYLDGAIPILTSDALMADILDPDRPAVVPLTFRTDGRWVWTDTVSYYLERYALAPEAGLLEHVRGCAALPAPVSQVALHRVLSFLQQPDESEGVWVVPETVPGEPSLSV